ALVSGAGWEAETGEWHGRTVEHEGRWGELQHCHAAVRPHPLPDTEWLTGAPVLGTAVLPLRTTDDLRERAQRFRFTVPPGPVSLGDWRSLGLRGWSGGVTYARELEVPAGADPVLDLGRVRGSVEVRVDGERVGEVFCAPYRFELRGAAGRTVGMEVTVHN